MPPVFKKAKDYDPQLALRTLRDEQKKPEAENRQLLIELGLVDESDTEKSPTGVAVKAKGAELIDAEEQRGAIAAYHPPSSNSGAALGVSKAVDKLRARVEASITAMHAGRLDEHAVEQVQELLFEQQHQIDLLVRGQFSLKGSMESMRRDSREVESQYHELQQQLEQQHGAALKEMEGKLELAILQVQQLQLATRERQHQQEACSQLSLQAASHEAAQAKTKVAELQALITIKDTALMTAQKRAEKLAADIAEVSAAANHSEWDLQQQRQQHVEATQELKDLAQACQAAQQQIAATAAALQLAEQEVSELKQQLHSSCNAQAALQVQLDDLHQQLHDAEAASQQQAATEAQLLTTEQGLSARCVLLEQQLRCATLASQQQDAAAHAELAAKEHVLLGRCTELEQQLRQAQAALVEQVAAATAEADGRQMSAAQCDQLTQQLQEATAANAELAGQVEKLDQLRLQLFDEVNSLQQQLAQATIAQSVLQMKRQQIQEQLTLLSDQQMAEASSNQQLLQQQQVMQEHMQQVMAKRERLTEQLREVGEQKTVVQQQLQAAITQQQEAQDKVTAADDNAKSLQLKVTAMQSEHGKAERQAAEQIRQLQEALNLARSRIETAQQAAEKRVADIQAAASKEVNEHRRKWREEFQKRRQLHNLIVELKGNIRVLARVRPMIEKEWASSGGGGDPQAVKVIDEETVAVSGATVKEYNFDKVFAPADRQEQVYQEVSPLVTSTLDGFNVCIMAYGQTGSGKTYTIEGPGSDPGVNSRALAELFQMAADRASEVTYQFSASVLEIYNEQIFDLLAGSRDTGDKLDIKEGPQGLIIPDLRIEPVVRPEDVTNVLQKGKQNRSTLATNMNEHSSRSHLVLTLYVKGQDLAKGSSWSAKLHLIDLAGSERVSRSGAEGERLKEAAAINKSLSALGDVVAALQQRSSHVPYRNSKLTRLLEDSLGGNSKTLMIVNCSPAAENAAESKCSLEFAARARKVELGAATRNIDSSPSSPAGTSGGAGSNGGSLRTSGISPLRTGSPVDGGNHSAVGSPRASRNLGDALGNSSRLGNSRRTGTQQQ